MNQRSVDCGTSADCKPSLMEVGFSSRETARQNISLVYPIPWLNDIEGDFGSVMNDKEAILSKQLEQLEASAAF